MRNARVCAGQVYHVALPLAALLVWVLAAGNAARAYDDIVWGEDNPITGGAITKPTDPHCVDSEVICEITVATDRDVRCWPCTYPFDTGLTYTWSSEYGSWKNGVNTGLSVTWLAPSTPGVYAIECKIEDTVNPPPGEYGDRNDDVDPVRDTTVTVVEVASISAGEEVVCTNTDVTFSATSNPYGNSGIFSWSGGGSPAGHTGSVFTTQWSEPGTKTVTVSCCTSSKSVEVEVVALDIDTDSNNDGTINSTDDPIEMNSPGRIVAYNDDDDDQNSTSDLLDQGAAQEDDLAEVNLSWSGANGLKLLLVDDGMDIIKVWKSPTKGSGNQITVSGNGTTYTIGTHQIPSTVYVEGGTSNLGEATLDWIFLRADDTEVCRDTVKFTVLKVELMQPSNGQKLIGYNISGGIRETRAFYVDLLARVLPAELADSATVTFIYSKGASSNSVTGTRVPGTNQFKYAQWDIRQRFTTTTQRYRIKARVSVGGVTCESPENLICILKGEQIVRVAAVANNDWMHYPYQWGSKGPNACSHVTNHGLPADGYYDHEPYDNENHPGEDQWHPCCYDCSGFAWKCLSYVGISLPQGPAAHQYDAFPDVGSGYKIGDLFFLQDEDGIHHVMVCGATGGNDYYEAPYTGEWTRSSSGAHDLAAGPSGDGWCMDDGCGH